MNTQIIIDSTADLMPEVKARLTVVPLTVHFGDREYIDGVTITHKEFYEKLVETDELPSTSQATPATFTQVFEDLEGREAVVLTLSSALSGTYQSAVIAAADFPNVRVVDSGTVAIGTGVLAERALQLADQGQSASQIAQTLEAEKGHVCVIAMLDTLEYLKRGGRISKTVAFAGGLLNIKPVVCVEEGQIKMLGKARGSRQGNNLLVQQIQHSGGVDFTRPVMLGYTGLSDALLSKYITDSQALWAESEAPLRYTCIGSVIGTHAGPNAIAAAYFRKQN